MKKAKKIDKTFAAKISAVEKSTDKAEEKIIERKPFSKVFVYLGIFWKVTCTLGGAALGWFSFYFEDVILPKEEKKLELEDKLKHVVSSIFYNYHSTLANNYLLDTGSFKPYCVLAFENKQAMQVKKLKARIVVNRKLFHPLIPDVFDYPLKTNSVDVLYSTELEIPRHDSGNIHYIEMLPFFVKLLSESQIGNEVLFKQPYMLIKDTQSQLLFEPQNPLEYNLPRRIKGNSEKIGYFYPKYCKAAMGFRYKIYIRYEFEQYEILELLVSNFTYLMQPLGNGIYKTLPLVVDDMVAIPYVFYREKGRIKYNPFYCNRNIHSLMQHREFGKNRVEYFDPEEKKPEDFGINYLRLLLRQDAADIAFVVKAQNDIYKEQKEQRVKERYRKHRIWQYKY